jgi:hypothetical protein
VVARAAPSAGAAAPLPLSLADGDWRAVPADGVELHLATESAAGGRPALRLDFDFHGHAGWAAARLPLVALLPENFEIRFALRGAAPANSLELKLIDETGENVWWHVDRDLAFPGEWTSRRVKRRQISFAWGRGGGGALTRLSAIELAITAGGGGRGSVWIRDLALVPVPPERPYAGQPVVTASAATAGHPAAAALDGEAATAWRAPAPTELTVDFGEPRELGGLTLDWEAGRAPAAFSLASSDDGVAWTTIADAPRAGAVRNDLRLPESETRYLRLRIAAAATPAGVGLAELRVRPLEFGASANDFLLAVAGETPRGRYPRAFSGEQSYWTLVGVDGDREESLINEDGAAELGERGAALEPLLAVDGALRTWADVEATQSLADGDLPLPTVAWSLAGLRLEIAALADGAAGASRLLLRYRLSNARAAPVSARLALAARPLQVNPPQQFLNVAGGALAVARVACLPSGLAIDGEPRLAVHPAPSLCRTVAFAEGTPAELLASGDLRPASELADPSLLASALLVWDLAIPAGGAREIVVAAPLERDGRPIAAVDAAGFAAAETAARAGWRARLDRVHFSLPPPGERLAALARSSLAWELVHRDGAALQPGSRAYARSWIRDGALTADALLRAGLGDAARDYALWYAGFQFADGRVPCCVDGRGADPVPENDSHGELIHLIAEVFRFTGDRAFAELLLPAVERAVAAIDALRATRRTAEFTAGAKRRFFGLLPESISHEGYSAKPMHSYWDDGFAYRGLADAAALARALGRDELASRWERSRDQFAADLVASIARTREEMRLDYLPGCAELGDFDSTSTTALVEPGGLDRLLPRAALAATFERYWRFFAARRDGRESWEAYTPYELRHVGVFVRLGWRARAAELLDFFLEGVRPPAWNGWGEVVGREARAPRFIGDLPHGWVASDYLRSFYDLFAYERRADGALVLAAGVPRAWLDRPQGIAVANLGSPWGPIGYRMRRSGRTLRVEIDALARWPAGGVELAPPLAGELRELRVDGVAQPASDAPIRLTRLPAIVEVEEIP